MEFRSNYEYALNRQHEGKQSFERNAEWLNRVAKIPALKQLTGKEQRNLRFIQTQIEASD